MEEEHTAQVLFIEAFLRSPVKVTSAVPRVAVPVSPDGARALLPGCWGLLAGQSCSPRSPAQHCSPSAPALLATRPPSHAACLCLCPPAAQEEAQKVEFLQAVSSLCKAATVWDFSEELRKFYEQYRVVESIKALVEEEPMDRLHTAVRQQAMLTLAQMSKVERLLEGRRKSLLETCFRKVFLLPPNAAGQGQDSFLYFETLDAMDILLESLVLSSPGHRLLQRILQVRHWHRAGFAGAVPHPGGMGVSTLEWTLFPQHHVHSTLRKGAQLPQGTQTWPTMLFQEPRVPWLQST
ncbi:uncharacterized protein AAGF69_012224 [Amazona ochrocephala]